MTISPSIYKNCRRSNFHYFATRSPPAWMKTPQDPDEIWNMTTDTDMTGSHQPTCLKNGTGKESKYAKAWALYFSKFLTACK